MAAPLPIRRPTPAAKPSADDGRRRDRPRGCAGSFAGCPRIHAARRATHRSGCPDRSFRARWGAGAGRRTRASATAATRGFATTGCPAWRSRSRSCSRMSAIRRPSPNRSAPPNSGPGSTASTGSPAMRCSARTDSSTSSSATASWACTSRGCPAGPRGEGDRGRAAHPRSGRERTRGRAAASGGRGAHGTAFVGAVGDAAEVEDFTALGDAVNTTARLASVAGSGEALISVEAAAAAGWRRMASSGATLRSRAAPSR